MTNLERLLEDKHRLAEAMVSLVEEPDYDENMDGEWEQCGTIDYYRTTDGSTFYDINEAVEYQLTWLNTEEGNQIG